jgi:hypothetical protein
MDMFDPVAGHLRDEAIDRVERGASPEWWADVERAGLSVATEFIETGDIPQPFEVPDRPGERLPQGGQFIGCLAVLFPGFILSDTERAMYSMPDFPINSWFFQPTVYVSREQLFTAIEQVELLGD